MLSWCVLVMRSRVDLMADLMSILSRVISARTLKMAAPFYHLCIVVLYGELIPSSFLN